MNFIDNLHKELEQFDLLKHSFYQYWGAGKLSNDTLKH